MTIQHCTAFVNNPVNKNRVDMEIRDYEITKYGAAACNELIKTDLDFSQPYKPIKSSKPAVQSKPEKFRLGKPEPKIDWGV